MSRLLKADLYRVVKSRLSLIALILALAFPVLIVFMYVGMQAISGFDAELGIESLFNANTLIGSVYSLSNNIGLVIPTFAGILVCSDFSNGTLRNKVVAGNRRSAIYLSHLIVSILFSTVVITIYAAVTTGLTLLFFPFRTEGFDNLGREILFFVVNGTMAFVFMATFTTMLAMVTRSTAPTIIFTVVFTIALFAVNSVIMLIDYEKFRYAVYFIPTFGSNFFGMNSFSLLGLFGETPSVSKELIFSESMLSYLFFGTLHTVIGMIAFQKRDLK